MSTSSESSYFPGSTVGGLHETVTATNATPGFACDARGRIVHRATNLLVEVLHPDLHLIPSTTERLKAIIDKHLRSYRSPHECTCGNYNGSAEDHLCRAIALIQRLSRQGAAYNYASARDEFAPQEDFPLVLFMSALELTAASCGCGPNTAMVGMSCHVKKDVEKMADKIQAWLEWDVSVQPRELENVKERVLH